MSPIGDQTWNRILASLFTIKLCSDPHIFLSVNKKEKELIQSAEVFSLYIVLFYYLFVLLIILIQDRKMIASWL